MLPLFRNIQATFYNKGIFDKFGVPYPKDGMTYDEAIELAKKVTRSVDGVQYYGLFPGNPAIQLGQLSQTFLDGKTDEPLLSSDNFASFAMSAAFCLTSPVISSMMPIWFNSW